MRLSSHFKSQRLSQNLSSGDLARLVGYKNISKGSNRIIQFEREGVIHDDLLIKLAKALGIDWATVEELAQQDRQEHIEAWTRWADEPVPMRLVVRLMATIYSNCSLPEEISTPEEAEKYACALARLRKMRICLVVSRRKSVWIGADGVVERRSEATPFGAPNLPWMALKGGRKFLLNFNPGS
jgi:transcriptional regulator with XRE-family HTH domain